ncbi:MAG: helix-turn-helix domain-containing protein [Methanobrevibacter sp.]|nr:helix-turn-helix domain-containing protein [Methanobrevibacter sp.]
MDASIELKEKVIELLKKGVPIGVIVKEYNLPQSTVSTWLSRLRKEQLVPTPLTNILSAKNNADVINAAEIKIATSISKIVSDDVSDREWIEVQKTITKELQAVVYKVQSDILPKADSKNNSNKIKSIVNKWAENPFIKKFELQDENKEYPHNCKNTK